MDGMMWDGNQMAPQGHPNQMNQQNQFNSNMSNNQQPMGQNPPHPNPNPPHQQINPNEKHNPVGSWQRGGWDSGIQSGMRFSQIAWY